MFVINAKRIDTFSIIHVFISILHIMFVVNAKIKILSFPPNDIRPVQNKSSEAEKSNETYKSNTSKTTKQTQSSGNDLNCDGEKSDEIRKSINEKLDKISIHSRDHENMKPQEQKIVAEENDNANVTNQSVDTKSVKSDNKDLAVCSHDQEDDALTYCTGE